MVMVGCIQISRKRKERLHVLPQIFGSCRARIPFPVATSFDAFAIDQGTLNPSSTYLSSTATMGWWKADPVDTPEQPPPPYQPSKLPPSHPPLANPSEADACPVDSKTREIWLQQAKAQRQQQSQRTQQQPQPGQQASSPIPQPTPRPTPATFTSTTASQSQECSSDRISQAPTQDPVTVPHGRSARTLSQDREVSTIPRAGLGQFATSTTTSIPSNSEQETGPHKSGNWIYPSETQFFNAVMRKASSPTSPQDLASSISSIIPIHNAVNERAWHLIKQWEGDSSQSCGGPKLLSFQGLGAGALSPKAKWKTTVMGAKEPFDRHDWTVERCGGEQVEYIIDFYQGREREDADPRRRGQELNFYLDVRPKLNTFEGWRMRGERWMGWR